MRLSLLLCSLLVAMPTLVTAAERSVERSFEVNPDVHLDLTSHRGSVEILTGSGTTLEIFVRIEHVDEDVLDQVDVVIDSSAARVAVHTEYDRESFDFNLFGFHDYGNDFVSPLVHYRIVVPEQASLKLAGSRARLDVQAPSGRLEITGRRSNGRITGVRSDLDLSTQRGNFAVEIAELHDVNLRARRGNYQLDVAATDDFALSGKTHRGIVSVSGKEVSQTRGRRGARVDHREGSGSRQITFDSQRGNVQIDFRD